MALTDDEAALLTITDLEIEWLRKVAVNIDPNSLSDLRALVMPDGPHPYWAATSGLAPAEKYSTTDHKRAAMLVAVPAATGSISDIARAFYAENLP